jgi:hypothetical protein
MNFLLELWLQNLDLPAPLEVGPASDDRKHSLYSRLYGVQNFEAHHNGNMAIETFGTYHRTVVQQGQLIFYFYLSCFAFTLSEVLQP